MEAFDRKGSEGEILWGLAGEPAGHADAASTGPGASAPVGAPPLSSSAAMELYGHYSEPAGGGDALPDTLRARFETSLGTDLSSVRLHTGADSAASADAVGARAYTLGRDIHFNEREYDPSSAAGQHLIAHEVAHTVQQSGAEPRPQLKPEVSSPGDAAEHEADRAADAMVGGQPASVAAAPAAIQREEKKEEKAPGPPPETPFDDVKVPPAALQAIDELTLDALRSLTNDKVNHAYTSYMQACTDVKAKFAVKKKTREDDQKEMMEFVLGAVGMMLGPVGAAVGAKIAGPELQGVLAGKVERGIGRQLLKEGVIDAQARQTLTEPVLKAITHKRITELVAKLTPDAAAGLIGGASKKVAGAVAKIALKGSKEDRAIAYVDALMRSSDGSSNALLSAVGACNDMHVLMGVYQQFAGATFDVYRTEIETRANDFETQVATTIGGGKDQIVIIPAFGRERLANVHYYTDTASYGFNSWVTPDMEPIVRQINPNPMTLQSENIHGHLPEPTLEGAVYGQEQIAKCNAWGRMRMVEVAAHKAFLKNHYGEIHFLRWIDADEEANALARGECQIGGISEVDPGRLVGLQAPRDEAKK